MRTTLTAKRASKAEARRSFREWSTGWEEMRSRQWVIIVGEEVLGDAEARRRSEEKREM